MSAPHRHFRLVNLVAENEIILAVYAHFGGTFIEPITANLQHGSSRKAGQNSEARLAIFHRRYLDGRDRAKNNYWLVTGQLIWYNEWLRIRRNTHLQRNVVLL
jgi:hypothetical protein